LAKQTGDSDDCIQNRLERLYRLHCHEWRDFPPRRWMLPQRKVA
jgi:hypothetical protein